MSKQPVRKAIPTFSSEAEERTFWETHDSSTFVDWRNARIAVFPSLRASTETISLRLPAALLAELKALANKRDVPYQSLLKVFLAERVDRETNVSNGLSAKPTRIKKARRRSPKVTSKRSLV